MPRGGPVAAGEFLESAAIRAREVGVAVLDVFVVLIVCSAAVLVIVADALVELPLAPPNVRVGLPVDLSLPDFSLLDFWAAADDLAAGRLIAFVALGLDHLELGPRLLGRLFLVGIDMHFQPAVGVEIHVPGVEGDGRNRCHVGQEHQRRADDRIDQWAGLRQHVERRQRRQYIQ